MDEMDLLKQLKGAPSLRPEAYERARATLGAAMTDTGPKPELVAVTGEAPARREKFFWGRNSRVGLLGKIGIGAVGAVAAAAVVVSVTSVPQSPVPAGTAAQPTETTDARLVTLAANVKATGGSLPGDASLVIRNTTGPDGKPYVTYNLYTDTGEVYFAESRSDLSGVVERHESLAEPTNSHVLAAAREAAAGDLGKAREHMVNAFPNGLGLGLSPAEAQKAWDKAEAERVKFLKEQKGVANPQPRPRPTGKAMEDLINNSVWASCVNALTMGAANSEVRAGVLRLIAAIPDVSVTKAATGGQPTLVLTAGPALFGGNTDQVLTIDAQTGLPISSVWKSADQKPSQATYKSARVTVVDIKAGKF
jgi:hypothetical protein